MVPLKFLRKRSSRFGATCWGITTHQANRADGLCKYCKGLPHPSACASLWVVIPQHVAPNLELLFPNYFSGTYGISVQFFLIGPVFLTGCTQKCIASLITLPWRSDCSLLPPEHLKLTLWGLSTERRRSPLPDTTRSLTPQSRRPRGSEQGLSGICRSEK